MAIVGVYGTSQQATMVVRGKCYGIVRRNAMRQSEGPEGCGVRGLQSAKWCRERDGGGDRGVVTSETSRQLKRRECGVWVWYQLRCCNALVIVMAPWVWCEVMINGMEEGGMFEQKNQLIVPALTN